MLTLARSIALPTRSGGRVDLTPGLGHRIDRRRLLQAGITLLEMLVVLVIIGLLVGLVGPNLLGRVDKAKVDTTNTQLKILKSALDTMRLDIGRYPTNEEGLAMLVTAPNDAGLRARWNGPYLEGGKLPDDGWNRAFIYSVPGKDGAPFALYSLGADGQPGGSGVDGDIGYLPR